jgi:hypothetical protein
MEKIILQEQSLSPNFIGSWVTKPLSIADELVDYCESNINKQRRGVIAGGLNLGTKPHWLY